MYINTLSTRHHYAHYANHAIIQTSTDLQNLQIVYLTTVSSVVRM